MEGNTAGAILVVVLACEVLPTIVAMVRGAKRAMGVFFLNLLSIAIGLSAAFLGLPGLTAGMTVLVAMPFSFAFWLTAFVWASVDRATKDDALDAERHSELMAAIQGKEAVANVAP